MACRGARHAPDTEPRTAARTTTGDARRARMSPPQIACAARHERDPNSVAWRGTLRRKTTDAPVAIESRRAMAAVTLLGQLDFRPAAAVARGLRQRHILPGARASTTAVRTLKSPRSRLRLEVGGRRRVFEAARALRMDNTLQQIASTPSAASTTRVASASTLRLPAKPTARTLSLPPSRPQAVNVGQTSLEIWTPCEPSAAGGGGGGADSGTRASARASTVR